MNVTESKFFIPAIMLLALILIGLVFSNAIVEKVADRVIERISKPYSPSPFGPGLDPDKLDGYRGAPLDWRGEWERGREN